MGNAALTGSEDQGECSQSSRWKNRRSWPVSSWREESVFRNTSWNTVIKSIQLLVALHSLNSLLGINANIDKTLTSWAEATRKGFQTNNSK